jgi:CTP:molybdopterin cytidylyltransferase MocA
MSTVFVSHSSLDKSSIVQPLVEALHKHNHEVWYDSETLKLGDSITLAISDGLYRSKYYVIAISPRFLASVWCMRELGAIISESISRSKKLIVLRVDHATIPSIISDIKRLDIQTDMPDQRREAFDRILRSLEDAEWGEPTTRESAPSDWAEILFEADRKSKFGQNLLLPDASLNLSAPENEGVILIKPGGTFYRPCLREIFRRIDSRCRIRQVRLFDGKLVKTRDLFDKQYVTSTKIARGEIRLNKSDIEKIRQIYNAPAFQAKFMVPYRDELIVPALDLCEGLYNLEAKQLAELWERGRHGGLFHNHRFDGLNKIGYQKNVFPIEIPSLSPPRVRIVLNGFIPGYKNLFIEPSARVVAIHVSSAEPWADIRETLVGGNSDPFACEDGSIRKDAAATRIALEPADDVVNGQRNICHCSATLFDGMRELVVWFEYEPRETLLGWLFELQGAKIPEQTQVTLLPTISWWTRDHNIGRVLFEVCQSVIKDELRLRTDTFWERVQHYAMMVGARQEAVRQSRPWVSFIQNGVRLSVAREDLYLRSIAELFENRQCSALFYEVAKEIKALASTGSENISDEVLAESYRIAAGDLRFLACPAYTSDCDCIELFKSLVIGELPEQALKCALRTEQNLVKDFRLAPVTRPTAEVTSIEDNPAWAEFRRSISLLNIQTPIITLILCGGRSTRMGSTIPKTVLPLGNKLLFNHTRDLLAQATGDQAEVVAAVGFRSNLVRRALGERARYLSYENTLGLAFRVATCLESLATHEGLVLLSYTDMPLVSPHRVRELVARVTTAKTFGLLSSHAAHLSGHIVETSGRITEIVQQRLMPERAQPWMPRDVGVYAFYNTAELREALRSVRNDNVRQEYIFADVVQVLSKRDWDIVVVEEDPSNAYGINTSGELLGVACGIDRPNLGMADLREVLRMLSVDYRMPAVKASDIQSFSEVVRLHTGPLHFLQWWNNQWE